MLTTLLVVGILVFLILVHELGHFFAAKLFNVKVEEFGLGYPPRAAVLKKHGDTEYTLNWIPFGGFVRMLGENADAPKKKGSFSSAPRYAQAVILVAGVCMNFIAGWLLFAGALYAGIPHAVTAETAGENAELVVSGILPGSPADDSEIIPGDEIVSVRDVASNEEATLTPEGVIEFVGARGGEELEITVLRSGEEVSSTIYPAHSVITESSNRPALGIGLVMVTSDSLPFFHSIAAALPLAVDKLTVVVYGFIEIFRNAFGDAPVLQGIVGPVGLVGVVGEASQHGIGSVLALAGFISINLVIVNLIPIPALDGGRLVLVAIESVIRRAAPRLAVGLLNSLGFAAIILLMVAVTYNDVVRLLF